MIIIVSTDERWRLECICQALSLNGFETVTGELSDCKDIFARYVPELVIANLSGNPEKDLEACQLLAKLSTAPIVVLTSC